MPVYAQYATSDCVKPDSSWPDWMPLMLATEPFDATAVATTPGAPQLPPLSQSREPGGLEIALAIRPPIG